MCTYVCRFNTNGATELGKGTFSGLLFSAASHSKTHFIMLWILFEFRQGREEMAYLTLKWKDLNAGGNSLAHMSGG